MKDQFQSIQESMFEYFKDTSDELLCDIVDSFVYLQPAANDKVSEVITKFLKENGIETAYVNYISEFRNQSILIRKVSMSESSIIEQIRQAFLSLTYNRFRKNLINKKKANNKTKISFNFMKNELLDIYERMNSDERFFHGKKEDARMVDKIENMKYEI